MGKFGIGAKVRDPDGDLAEVIGKPKKGFREVRYNGGKYDGMVLEWSKDTLEPANDNADFFPRAAISESAYSAASAEEDKPWVPKVGDRVRFTDECSKSWWFGPHTANVDGVIERDNGVEDGYRFKVKVGESIGFVDPEHIQPLVIEPAPFTIEAGRFYRTRDGRKVGPMVRRTESQWGNPYTGDFIWTDLEPTCGRSDHTWQADGHQFYTGDTDCNDLVAEWVEPTPEPEVAVAEATATAAPKFKAGDKVRPVSGKLGWVTSHWDAYWKAKEGAAESDTFFVVLAADWGDVKISTKPDGDGPYWSADSFELVEPAAPPAKFKVGDRVVVVNSDYSSAKRGVGKFGTVAAIYRDGGAFGVVMDGQSDDFDWGFAAEDIDLASDRIPIGSQVTFTATGRLSAYTTDGHAQIVFPGLTPGQNSFALPAAFVTAA